MLCTIYPNAWQCIRYDRLSQASFGDAERRYPVDLIGRKGLNIFDYANQFLRCDIEAAMVAVAVVVQRHDNTTLVDLLHVNHGLVGNVIAVWCGVAGGNSVGPAGVAV